MFLIAPDAQALARWDCAERAEGPGSKLDKLPTENFSREARSHEHAARIKNGADLYREMDTQDFVFSEAQVLSARSVAPPPGEHFPADAHQNSSQSRIHRISRSAHHEIEHGRCRVFLDPARNDHHRPARRHVPLGETSPQARESSRAPGRNATGTVHDNYAVETSPNPRWIDITNDPQEAARKRAAEAKA